MAIFWQVPGVGLLETGATWMHGVEGHPAYEYARQHGILPERLDESERQWGQQHFFREDMNQPLASDDRNTVLACVRSVNNMPVLVCSFCVTRYAGC